jgi:hypothetical protein
VAVEPIENILRRLDEIVNRFHAQACTAPTLVPLREYAGNHGSFTQDLPHIPTMTLTVMPSGVRWQIKGEGLSDDYYLVIEDNSPWRLLHDRSTNGNSSFVEIGHQGSPRLQGLDPSQMLQLFNSFNDTMSKYLDTYVGQSVPVQQPGPNDQTVVIPVVPPQPDQQFQPNGTKAITALIAALLAIPLTSCCIIPGYASFIIGLILARKEMKRYKKAGLPISGTLKAAWIISLLDIPGILILTIILIVNRISGYDTGGGY